MASKETFELNNNVGDLDVVSIYKELMSVSTAEDSAYLRVKETLNSFFEDSSLSEKEKATIIAKSITGIAESVTTNTLNAAVQIAKENRDAPYELSKLKEETILVQEQANKIAEDVLLTTGQISKTAADTLLVKEQVKKIAKDIELADLNINNSTFAGWKLQSELYRDYGVETSNLDVNTTIIPAINYTNYGLKVETLNKAKVDTYATYSSAYRTNGVVNYTLNTDGQLNTAQGSNIGAGTVAEGLTYAQTNLAIRNEKGFDDNQRQHVVNSSATMMSMLLGTEASGIDYSTYLSQYNEAAIYLNQDH